MNRILLVLALAVSLLLASGAGRPAAARQSVQAVAAARKALALQQAEQLLGRVPLPRGAEPTPAPAALSHADHGVSVETEFAWRHRVWRLRQPLHSVVVFFERHRLAHFELGVSGRSPQFLDFGLPPTGGWPMQRQLDLEFVSASGWTFVRADAGAAWIYPRSPREVLPAGVREIDIRDDNVSRRVTEPAQVGRIVRWFDRLPVMQPGPAVSCMAIMASRATFVFRSAADQALARAVVPSRPADGCYPIEFTLGDKRQTPLIDGNFGRGAFVHRVERRLGLSFPSR